MSQIIYLTPNAITVTATSTTKQMIPDDRNGINSNGFHEIYWQWISNFYQEKYLNKNVLVCLRCVYNTCAYKNIAVHNNESAGQVLENGN
jgi:hypothetical protein